MRRRKRRSASAGSIAIRTECLSWFAPHAVGQIARCFYYFFMIVVVIRYKTKATARSGIDVHRPYLYQRLHRHCSPDKFHVCGTGELSCGAFALQVCTRVSADNQSANSQCEISSDPPLARREWKFEPLASRAGRLGPC